MNTAIDVGMNHTCINKWERRVLNPQCGSSRQEELKQKVLESGMYSMCSCLWPGYAFSGWRSNQDMLFLLKSLSCDVIFPKLRISVDTFYCVCQLLMDLFFYLEMHLLSLNYLKIFLLSVNSTLSSLFWQCRDVAQLLLHSHYFSVILDLIFILNLHFNLVLLWFFYIRKKFICVAHYNSLTQCLPPCRSIFDVLWSLRFYGLFTSFHQNGNCCFKHFMSPALNFQL